MPHILDGDAFQLVTRTYETGFHIHFVKFDVLVCDGANVGWNYDSSVLPGETIQYSYYADVELKAWFFHDHLYPVMPINSMVYLDRVLFILVLRNFSIQKQEKKSMHGTQITAD